VKTEKCGNTKEKKKKKVNTHTKHIRKQKYDIVRAAKLQNM